MSTLIVGDLHLKHRHVLPRIDGLIAGRTEIGRVVFLGDSCDEWGAREADELGALSFFADWARERTRDGLELDVLIGNHDMCYIRGKRGPGTIVAAMRRIRHILEDEIGILEAACAVGPCLCTHAGVTGIWAKRCLLPRCGQGAPNDAEGIARELNGMLADSACWEALDSCPPSRGGWSLPGPLWSDLRDLAADPLAGVPQIVGHTPVPTAANISRLMAVAGTPDIWACDTMSLTSGGIPLGDGSMLIVGEAGDVGAIPFPGGEYAEVATRYWLNR